MTRRCSICRCEKDLAEFETSPSKPQGRGYRCRACNRARRATHPGAILRSLETHRAAPGRKVCRSCKNEKNLGEFPANRHMRDGRQSYCRDCSARAQRSRRAAQPELRSNINRKQRAYYADRYAAGTWQLEQDPVKRRARRLLTSAVHRGKIRKPMACEGCAAPTPKGRLHGHHHRGYDRPYDVRWLCASCHGREHRSVA